MWMLYLIVQNVMGNIFSSCFVNGAKEKYTVERVDTQMTRDSVKYPCDVALY